MPEIMLLVHCIPLYVKSEQWCLGVHRVPLCQVRTASGELLRVKKWVVDPVPTWLGDDFNCLMMMQLAGMDLFLNIHALPCTCTNNLFLYA